MSDIALHCDSGLSLTKFECGERTFWDFFCSSVQNVGPRLQCMTHPPVNRSLTVKDSLHQESGSHGQKVEIIGK